MPLNDNRPTGIPGQDPDPARPPRPGTADSNLLFGIIALQSDFLTREQLVAGFDTWVHDKSRTLADILQSQGALSAEDREILERLVGRFLAKHGGDAEQSLAALSAATQIAPHLEPLRDPELMASLGHLGRSPAVDRELESTLLQPATSSLGRFRILRLHAKGGLGQVSVALDQDLNREVALKEIQPRLADDEINRERFVLEAEITGGLEHPGIVPVYASGYGPDGRPFYAMRFVKGDSLKQVIEAYHRADNPNRKDPGTRQLALRQLLGRFIDVCNAMEFSHSRGVLHRDLKPGNIMVGKYGETLVVDWGLAKSVERREIVTDELTLRPISALSSSGQTQPGSAIGTPAYMSPEQAAGRLDELGPASDVYSLGATLYHLLCGRAPFESRDLAELFASLQRGDFPTPRALCPEVPRGLEAICLKAMRLDPSQRYRSARQLAEDVEHWLADEPLKALPERFSDRFSRFARKHRGLMRAGGAALLAIAVVSAAAAVMIDRSRHTAVTLAERNRHLADEAEKGRTEAIASRESARENAELAWRRFYAAQMNLALQAADEHQLGRVLKLLEELRPQKSGFPEDLRSFDWYHLWHDCHRGHLLTLRGHTLAAESVAFSPDARWLATGAANGVIRLWNRATGDLHSQFGSDQTAITSLYFTADSRTLLSSSWDGTVRRWDVTRGTEERLLLRGTPIWNMSVSRDGQWAAVGGGLAPITVLDTETGEELARFERPASPNALSLTGVVLSKEAGLLAACWQDHVLYAWDLTTRQLRHELRQNTGQSTAISPDGQWLATGDWEGSVQVWNAATGAAQTTLQGHRDLVSALTFSADSKTIAAGLHNGTVRTWNLETGEQRQYPHLSQIATLAFSPDGTRLASTSSDGTAKVWDLSVPSELPTPPRSHIDSVGAIEFSRDGRWMVSTDWKGRVKLWDAAKESIVATVEDAAIESPMLFSPRRAVFSPDGTRLLYPSSDRTVKICEVPSGRVQSSLPGHAGIVQSTAWSSDGAVLASASDDGMVIVWNAVDGAERQRIRAHERWIPQIALSPDGSILATTGAIQRCACLWNAATGELLVQIDHSSTVYSLAFSADGKTLAIASLDQTADLLDLATLKVRTRLRSQSGGITTVAWLPDGRTLAGRIVDGTVILWDAVTGQERALLRNGRHPISWGIAGSSTGTFAMGGDESGIGCIDFWHAATEDDVRRQSAISQ